MTKRLSRATLGELSLNVRRPAYDRSSLGPGVVHIGLGAFPLAARLPLLFGPPPVAGLFQFRLRRLGARHLLVALGFHFRRLEDDQRLLRLDPLAFLDQHLRDAAAEFGAEPDFLNFDDA